jgi:hypothetical protein
VADLGLLEEVEIVVLGTAVALQIGGGLHLSWGSADGSSRRKKARCWVFSRCSQISPS